MATKVITNISMFLINVQLYKHILEVYDIHGSMGMLNKLQCFFPPEHFLHFEICPSSRAISNNTNIPKSGMIQFHYSTHTKKKKPWKSFYKFHHTFLWAVSSLNYKLRFSQTHLTGKPFPCQFCGLKRKSGFWVCCFNDLTIDYVIDACHIACIWGTWVGYYETPASGPLQR